MYPVIDTLALTLLLLIAWSFIRSAPRTTIAWLITLIAFNYACYLLSARQDYAFALPAEKKMDFGAGYILLNLARNSISAIFMMLAHALFREGKRLPRLLLGLFALQLFLEEPLAWILGEEWSATNPGMTFLLYEFIPVLLQFTFGGFAAWWAVAELKADLVASRRIARLLLLRLVVVQGLISLLVERMAFMGGLVPPMWMYPIHMSLVALQAAIFGVVVLSLLRRDVLDFLPEANVAANRSEQIPDDDNRDLAKLTAALEKTHIYRENGLSVAELARHLAIPEYRLRNLIHHELGFRNFNAFLHHYRIADIARALEDPTQNQTPILTLALSAGYQSINPFNRAFRELKQMTPTEYRVNSQREA